MDSVFTTLFSWQFMLFSLGVFTIVWMIRTIVEYALPNADGNKLWEKLLLPIMPITIGSIISFFATKYAYPDGLTSVSGRLFFGSVAGMFSGLVYQLAKGMLKDKLGSLVSSADQTLTSVALNPAKPIPPTPTQ